jgi:hypothetical protein
MEEEEDEPTISTQNPTENSELLLSPDDLDNITISHAELEELWINVKTSHSQTLAHEHDQKKDIPIKELVPEEYHEWLDVFNEKASDRFPDSRPWDHAIDTKEGFEPKNFKAYALSPEEHKLQKEFVDENLEKGYIRPSKSPMASPFFFVAKKEKDKVRPTQDYRYLNDWTIKNAYPYAKGRHGYGHASSRRSEVLHQIRHSKSLQQRQDQKRTPMESSIQNALRII